MKILLRSPFSQFSGYGRDGIGLALALLDRGHDVRIAPAHVSVPLPREIAALMTYPYDGIFDLALHHREPEQVDLDAADASVARCNVLWTMWSWRQFTSEPWLGDFVASVGHFDHVVVYDSLSHESFSRVVNPAKLHTLLGGYSSADWEPPAPQDRVVRHEPFTFGMNGRLTIRKGVYTAVRAFNQLRDEHGADFNARLVLRSTEAMFPPEFTLPDGVEVIGSRALPPELRDFYLSLDTLLAPSWAEGKHLPPIEALTCGVPVIMSDIPGHRQWATSDMVTWADTVTRPLTPGYDGGFVSPDALAAAMWKHYTDIAPERAKAERASRTLPAMLDWSKALERLGLQLGMRL